MQRYTSTKLRSVDAVIFFLFWLIVLYVGADHPLPPGFVALVLLDLAVAALVYWRVPVYWMWSAARGGRALPLVVRDGLPAGLLFAAVALAGAATGAVTNLLVGLAKDDHAALSFAITEAKHLGQSGRQTGLLRVRWQMVSGKARLASKRVPGSRI